MSVAIESPHSSLVFSSLRLDSLSPPPTPVAKRARHFFPSNAQTPPPTPMFFPKSQSLLGNKQRGLTPAKASPRKQLNYKPSQRPVPTLRLQPRHSRPPTTQPTNEKEKATDPNRVPLMPSLSFEKMPSDPSRLSPKTSDNGSPSSSDSSCGPSRMSAVATKQQQVKKLPSFQRSGMHSRTIRRCNSLVARSA